MDEQKTCSGDGEQYCSCEQATFIIPPEGHKAMVYGFVRSQNELYGTDIDPEEVWQAVLAGLEENE